MNKTIYLAAIIILSPLSARADYITELLERNYKAGIKIEACEDRNGPKSMIQQVDPSSSNNYVYQHWVSIEGFVVQLHVEERNGSISEYNFNFETSNIEYGNGYGKNIFQCFKNKSDYLNCKSNMKTALDTIRTFYDRTALISNEYTRATQVNGLTCANHLLNQFKNVLMANSPKK